MGKLGSSTSKIARGVNGRLNRGAQAAGWKMVNTGQRMQSASTRVANFPKTWNNGVKNYGYARQVGQSRITSVRSAVGTARLMRTGTFRRTAMRNMSPGAKGALIFAGTATASYGAVKLGQRQAAKRRVAKRTVNAKRARVASSRSRYVDVYVPLNQQKPFTSSKQLERQMGKANAQKLVNYYNREARAGRVTTYQVPPKSSRTMKNGKGGNRSFGRRNVRTRRDAKGRYAGSY